MKMKMKEASNKSYMRNSATRQNKREFGGGDNGNNNESTLYDRKLGTARASEFDNVSTPYLTFIGVFRILTCSVWAGGILYSTYHVYKAAEEYLPFQREPDMNPGLFSGLLQRGRDSSDHEWVTFSPLLWTKMVLANIVYQILKTIMSYNHWHKITPWISPIISLILFWNTVGLHPTLHMLGIPVIYWLALRSRQKSVIWGITGVLILYIGSHIIHVLFPSTDEGEMSLYIFVVASAWSLSRGVSFCMDIWDRSDQEKFSIQSLLHFQQYVFYLPLSHCGPLVMYDHFEKQIILKPSTSSKTGNLYEFGKTICKLLATSALVELIYHYIYFRALSVTIPLIYDLNLWAVCGTVYWLGHIFTLKYKVLYGIPSCLAEFDGLSMYPLISCPAYIHRYSALWKDFDRGLYTFLVKYIYSPLIRTFNDLDQENTLNKDIKKLAASFVTFIYIFIWHSTCFDVFVWTAFNFLGITIERIGSLIKRKIDSVKRLNPITWDFLIEPIVTVPLAGMSILNSSVFCGKFDSAEAFSRKLYWTWNARYSYHALICVFLYCFTHVGVTVRTWEPFSQAVINRWRGTDDTKKQGHKLHET